ncbi:MAG: hypothetical protein JSS60_07075 [Verrucomicrobia bacterium]|nr:hypothetical protein [Verrucomicrobiota bacterium]
MNQLLNAKIESLLTGQSLNALSKEREKLTKNYRGRDGCSDIKTLSSDVQRLAYLAARLPATYAVVRQVLVELIKRSGFDPIFSLLDVGAGPGTALLAAAETSLPLKKATMLERDPGFIALGRQLAADLGEIGQTWLSQDITNQWAVEPHDLVIASYSLNELREKERLELVEKLWGLTQKFLVIIEPGSKFAFESLKKMRQGLLLNGANLMAPCPHSNACPMSGNDWCHFSARVERSSFHRKTKDATLNYEDEKFSYLIFSRNKVEPCQSRVLRRPFKGEGFIKLQLCSKSGIEEKTVTKKNKPLYSYTRKIECGDSFSEI